jgi:predicted HicB family RNase H-like nuclease
VLVVATLLGSLTACGDPAEAYCSALQSDQKLFAAMQDDTTGLALLRHRAALHDLADKAPDDLTDEWQTFLGAVDAFAATLSEVGVKPDDFVDGKTTAGLSEADHTRIVNAANELSSDDVVEAANGIEQQAKDVCKVQLGL